MGSATSYGRECPKEVAIAAPRKAGHPAFPRGKKPTITKRVYAKTDWPRALRFRAQGMTYREIATLLGVPYSTIQVGLLQRMGPVRLE